jgi:hypothetical protein
MLELFVLDGPPFISEAGVNMLFEITIGFNDTAL